MPFKTVEKPLLLEKRRVTSRDLTFELVVADRPVRAGIDPYNKLVDRNSSDNVKRTKESNGSATERA